MSQPAAGEGNALDRFPLPLPSLGIEIRATPEDLADAAKEALETEATWGLGEPGGDHFSEFSVAPVGSLLIAAGRTTPVALQYRPGDQLIVEMCYAGHSRFRDGATQLRTVAGGMLVFPSAGGTLCGGFHSGISFTLERDRLRRTARAMLGDQSFDPLSAPVVLQGAGADRPESGLMFSLFRHLDAVFREDRYLPSHLELDDQIYRTLVHQVARECQLELRPGPRDGRWRRTAVLDDLVDFIRATAPDQRLSLTDLEERSHFSARYLQVLFREAFDCTPMQFVRRQRLAVAMERLQTADCGDSITRIARDCGYRHLSNFSADFYREFAVRPSQVLRASQRP